MDATGATDEELHLATLRNLAYGFAFVTTTEEMLHGLLGVSKRKQRPSPK
jgi:isochorismate hydrolase